MKAIEAKTPTHRKGFLTVATVGVALLCWVALSSPAFAAARPKLHRKAAFRASAGGAQTLSPSACVPASMQCGTTVSGVLTTDDCPFGDDTYYDAWTFEVTAGQHVRITMASGSFDTYLFLYNPATNKVAEDDDSGEGPDGTNSKIEYDVTVSGTYTIFANSFFEFETGPYSLDLVCTGGGGPPPTCTSTATTLCLNNGRFRVGVTWRVPSQGTSGVGTASTLTSDTGYFWFFSANNIELVIKVVDGRAFNQHFWVFYGALSDVEYTITVTDTVTGAVKTYTNPQGHLASVADVIAFPGGPAAAPQASSPPKTTAMADFLLAQSRDVSAFTGQSASAICFTDGTTLCLNGGRFQVRVSWRVPTQGTSGSGQAVPLTSDTGYFWFFSANNIELVIKAVDGRAFNGFFWVFYGALSDVEYTITVTDSETGAVRTYSNPQGQLASVADVAAFR
jgi:pre-peptidase